MPTIPYIYAFIFNLPSGPLICIRASIISSMFYFICNWCKRSLTIAKSKIYHEGLYRLFSNSCKGWSTKAGACIEFWCETLSRSIMNCQEGISRLMDRSLVSYSWHPTQCPQSKAMVVLNLVLSSTMNFWMLKWQGGKGPRPQASP